MGAAHWAIVRGRARSTTGSMYEDAREVAGMLETEELDVRLGGCSVKHGNFYGLRSGYR